MLFLVLRDPTNPLATKNMTQKSYRETHTPPGFHPLSLFTHSSGHTSSPSSCIHDSLMAWIFADQLQSGPCPAHCTCSSVVMGLCWSSCQNYLSWWSWWSLFVCLHAKEQSHLIKNSHRTIKTEVGMGRCLFLCRKVSFPAGGWCIWPSLVPLHL